MAHIERYINEPYPGIDTNTTAVTAWVDVTTCESLAFYVEGKTGTNANHKIGIQMSPDGIFSGGFHMEDGSMSLITGEGHKHIANIDSMAYVRLAVQTVEGAASTCDLYLQVFRHKE